MALWPSGVERSPAASLLAQARAQRERSGAVQTQALMSEAMGRKLVASATEQVARSHVLLERVRRSRESSLREAASILERLRTQDAQPGSAPDPVDGQAARGARLGEG